MKTQQKSAYRPPAALGAKISLRDLRVGYDQQDVLRDITLDVGAGEFIALLGASGCGKTTLLRALAGFVPIRSGSVHVSGRDIGRIRPEKRGMAMMFQSYALWPHMSVAQNIGYGLRLRGKSRREVDVRVREMSELVGLQDLLQRRPSALSGGQQQRVALVRALAIDPPVLLLDEPLSNLDAGIRAAMRHEIRTLQQRLGLTTVLVTHDREEAMSMADRVVILSEGRIAQVGSPEEVFHRPNSPYVARFMGASNMLHGIVQLNRDFAEIHVEGSRKISLPIASGGRPGVHFPDRVAGQTEIFFHSEAATFSEPSAASETSMEFSGTVMQVAYLGSVYRHEVQVQDTRVMVDHPERKPVDSKVDVRVPATALGLFPAGTRVSLASQ